MTQIVCPTCDSALEVDDGVIGQQVQCGSCQEVFVAEEPKKSKSGKSSKSKSRSRRDDGDTITMNAHRANDDVHAEMTTMTTTITTTAAPRASPRGMAKR